jgi:hypothetical protein
VSPLGAVGAVVVQVSAVVAPVMAAEEMTGAVDVLPISTQAEVVGQAIWVTLVTPVGVSAAKVTLEPAVVAPYMTSAAVAVWPVSRHFVETGQ